MALRLVAALELAQDASIVKGQFLANMSGLNIDTHHVNTQGIPTLAQLQQYDVVLLWENGLFRRDSPATGNVVEQYVQGGGNLILGTFYWQNRSSHPFFGGNWGNLENIDPFTGSGSRHQNDFLDAGSIVPHPLTTGLNSMSGRFRGGTVPKPGTVVVANWTDGSPLIGYTTAHCIVAISHFPAHNFFVPVSGDFYLMWENASGCLTTDPMVASVTPSPVSRLDIDADQTAGSIP